MVGIEPMFKPGPELRGLRPEGYRDCSAELRRRLVGGGGGGQE